MIVEQVLGLLQQGGVRLSLHQGDIRYEAPKGALTADLIDLIRKHRDAIALQLSVDAVPPPRKRPSKR